LKIIQKKEKKLEDLEKIESFEGKGILLLEKSFILNETYHMTHMAHITFDGWPLNLVTTKNNCNF